MTETNNENFRCFKYTGTIYKKIFSYIEEQLRIKFKEAKNFLSNLFVNMFIRCYLCRRNPIFPSFHKKYSYLTICSHLFLLKLPACLL